MTERLTPEQFQKLIDDFAYDGGDIVGILTALEQARNQARTLARVRAWTESDTPVFFVLQIKPHDIINACKSDVAALLRAEED